MELELSPALKDQARMVIELIVNGAIRLIEAQPLGSFVPARTFNEALIGVGAMLNFRVIQDRMRERGSSVSFYMIKGPGGATAGLLVISADAQEAVNNVFGPRKPGPFLPRSREQRPPVAVKAQ